MAYHYRNDCPTLHLEQERFAGGICGRSWTKKDGIITRLKSGFFARATRSAVLLPMFMSGRATHAERVAAYAAQIGRVMELDKENVKLLHRGGLLHDIGKLGTRDTILQKRDALSEEEYDEVKCHPEIGAKILGPIEKQAEIISVVLQHHERYDGKGYPFGLVGTEISLYGRIAAVADVYDALNSVRPYRRPWEKGRVVDYIVTQSGSHFDPIVVEAFKSIVDDIPELHQPDLELSPA